MSEAEKKAIELTREDISKMDELTRAIDHTMSSDKIEKINSRIDKIDIRLAKRAKKFGEDFFYNNMSDLCCSYEEQLELLD